MSNKTIAQLSAKTPVITDLVPVADPVTGIAGKSTVQETLDGVIINKSDIVFTPPIGDDIKTFPYSGASNFTIATTQTRKKFEPIGYGDVLPYSVGPWIQSNCNTIDPESAVQSIVLNSTKINSDPNSTSNFGNWANMQSFSAPNLVEGALHLPNSLKLTSFNVPELKYGSVTFTLLNSMTGTLVIPKMVRGNFQITTSTSISGLSFPELVTSDSIQMIVSGVSWAPNFTSGISAPKLKYLQSFNSNYLQIPISFPELISLTGNFTTGGYATSINLPKARYLSALFHTNSVHSFLTSVNVPKLEYLYFGLYNSQNSSGYPLLTEFNFPELISLGMPTVNYLSQLSFNYSFVSPGVSVNIGSSSPNLTTITFPKLKFAAGQTNSFNITAAPNLSVFTINPTPKFIQGNFIVTGAALNQASVDGILVALAYMDGTVNAPYPAYSSKTVNLSGGTSATPSATGLAAKATLVARGCTVTHN